MFGCMSMITYGGYVESVYQGVRNQTIYSGMGHLQVFKKGFNEFGNTDPDKYMLNQKTVQKIMAIIQNYPEIETVTRRIYFSGLLNNGSISNGVFGSGVEAENEYKINHTKDTKTIDILKGTKLTSDQTEYVMLGQALADSFDVKVEDSLTLISSTIEGSVNAMDVKVGAIVTTGDSEKDERFILANLKDIQGLKNTEKVTRLTLLLNETDLTATVQNRLAKDFAKAGLDLEMKNWDELAGLY